MKDDVIGFLVEIFDVYDEWIFSGFYEFFKY